MYFLVAGIRAFCVSCHQQAFTTSCGLSYIMGEFSISREAFRRLFGRTTEPKLFEVRRLAAIYMEGTWVEVVGVLKSMAERAALETTWAEVAGEVYQVLSTLERGDTFEAFEIAARLDWLAERVERGAVDGGFWTAHLQMAVKLAVYFVSDLGLSRVVRAELHGGLRELFLRAQQNAQVVGVARSVGD